MLFYISRFIFAVLIRLLFKYRITGEENLPKPPFIVTSNHASLLDPPLVGMACWRYPVDFMAKKELFDAPIIGAWTRSVRCIEANRGENSVRGIREAIRRISKGHVVGVFPEGTRSTSGELQEAKRGIGFLIAKANVPVVPIYISGSREAFPKGEGIKPGALISITVGRPIMPEVFSSSLVSKKDYEAISNMVMDHISSLKAEAEGTLQQNSIATFNKKG